MSDTVNSAVSDAVSDINSANSANSAKLSKKITFASIIQALCLFCFSATLMHLSLIHI